VPVIAEKLGCHQKRVRRWLHRFNDAGLDGLGNRPGGGRKRRITEAERSVLIALAAADPPGRPVRDATCGQLRAPVPGGPGEWTLDTLTQAARDLGVGIGRSQVRRILLAGGVRWRRTRSWASSTDPEFGPKGRPSWGFMPPRRTIPR
jgi:transposase